MAKMKSKKLAERLIKKSIVKKKSLNPFEIHVNRQKFDVLGRKSKNDRGLPGVARSKSIKKRKETLLQEYKVANKSNKFVDRRIGEKNSTMTAEDRIMARFTAERMKQHNKKTMFNLNDEEVLTHRGKTLSEIEKYDDVRSDDDDDEFTSKGGGLDANFVEDAHFGGAIFHEKGEGAKTHASLIDELIAESKKRKAERQFAKEKTLELTDKLDADWHELQPLFGKDKPEDQVDQRPEKGSYDHLMRELRFEARGMPSDRLKSEDEIAKEEKDRLEKLEQERIKRMKGLDANSSHNPELKHRSADDLDDGLAIESEVDDDGDNYGEKTEENDNEDSDKSSDNEDTEDSGEEEKEENEHFTEGNEEPEVNSKGEDNKKREDNTDKNSEKDQESINESESGDSDDDLSDLKQSSDDEDNDPGVESEENKLKNEVKIESDNVQDEDLENDTEKIKAELLHKKQIMEEARKEVPYTFKIPRSYEELQEVLGSYNPDQQSVVIERMIKCHHPKLGENNKQKLEELFPYLLQLLNDAEDDVKWKLLDRLAPHLFDLTQFSPENCAHCLIEVLTEKHDDFKNNPTKFPDSDTLVFLKLIPLLFPTSDVRHRVATPAIVFLTQMLSQCRVRGRRSIATGLFVVTLVLEYVALSKRFSPEVILFLQGILKLAVPEDPEVSQPSNSLSRHPLVLNKEHGVKDKLVKKITYSDLALDGPLDDHFRMNSILTTVELLKVLSEQISYLPAFQIMFKPIEKLLSKLENCPYPSSLKENIKTIRETINQVNSKKLEYLVLERKKPKALRLYEPLIEKVTDSKRRRNVSEETAEHQKLVAKYKKEMKGALREIRKDNSFLAKVKFQDQARSDEERRRKVKQIYSWGAEQEGEYKKMKRKKK